MTKSLSALPAIAGLLVLFTGCTKETVTPNKVPIVDAGSSSSITLPVDSAILAGTGTDPDGKVVAYLWSEVSGPSAVTIVNPGSPTTRVKGFQAGKYVFQLMVTDSMGATGVDTTSVTVVNPPGTKMLTLQPNNNSLEYIVSFLGSADQTGPTNVSIEADAWTTGGQQQVLRGLVKFDLSSIPVTAVIKTANLYLYSNPTPGTGNLVDANYGSANSFIIQQVISNWSASGLSWSNQPSTTTANQVVIGATSQSVLDVNADVTGIIASMVNNNTNYGFLLKLQSETVYNSRIFVSSHNTTYPDKHPKLVITYQ